MIDIHCHILPGIDDGAANIEQSIILARHAVADGIRYMVVTPHIQPGVYDNDATTITTAFAMLVAALKTHHIALNVAMAAEVRLCPEILPMLEDDDFPLFVASDGTKTILLELPHSHIPPGTLQLIRWLQNQCIHVLIAHPERNKEIMNDYHKAQPFVDMGCKLQLTAGSVSGRFGTPPRLAAEYMLKQNWVSVLASDAHNMRSRPPQLSDGYRAAAAIVGKETAHHFVRTNPWRIVGGMFG